MVNRWSLSRHRVVGTACVALAVVGASWIGVRLSAGSPNDGFYLVIGASAAKGFEPSGSMTPRGPAEGPTANGYANDVDAMLATTGTPLALQNISCPGETIQTFVGGGDACTPTTSMLSRAENILHDQYEEKGVVTIDVGFNNIRPCLQFASVDESCVASTVALIKEDLPQALSGLEKAAGPGVTFVGVPYGDPFLGHYVNSSLGPANATSTLVAMNRLDTALDGAFKASKIAVAPITTALKMNDTKKTGRHDGQVVPENVATACDTTWMCRPAPWGPNDHPNNDGYSLIAKAIVGVLPRSF
jgi:lysophospholipase L1-like esterase